MTVSSRACKTITSKELLLISQAWLESGLHKGFAGKVCCSSAHVGGWDQSYTSQQFQWLQLIFHKHKAPLHLWVSAPLRLPCLVLLQKQQNDNHLSSGNTKAAGAEEAFPCCVIASPSPFWISTLPRLSCLFHRSLKFMTPRAKSTH